MAQRRNSPSYNQVSKVPRRRLCLRLNKLTFIKKPMFTENSSPFDSSPVASNSPRLYWQSRDPASPSRFGAENRSPGDQRDGSSSPSKRSSIENLKRASRVKNSNMFAREHNQEYDPSSSPMIERPLASGRPLSIQAQGNAYGGKGLEGFRNQQQTDPSKIPVYSPVKTPGKLNFNPQPSQSPGKTQVSPTKSSLSSKSRYAQAQTYNPESEIWSDDEEPSGERQLPPGKSLHRHAKSVTFDAAPPQVNEYEMTTPDPSSVASGSREGSYDSGDNEEDESFERESSMEHDDSFDASLEDTQKTPVVLPEDWRFMSPEVANDDLAAHVDDPFEEPRNMAPGATSAIVNNTRSSPTRTDSVNSNGDHRPLPPLPGLDMPLFPRARSDSNTSLTATAERASSAQRTLPSPPQPASITKAEIQGMGGCSMSIEDRLRLMMIQDEETEKSPNEEQGEQCLHKGVQSVSLEKDISATRDDIHIYEDELEDNGLGDLGEYKVPPRISRESILRKVKSKRQMLDNSDQEDSYSPAAPQPIPKGDHIDNIDPDIALPSLEAKMMLSYGGDGVVIKQEDDEQSEVDVYSIPDLYSQHLEAEAYADSVEEHAGLSMEELSRIEEDDQSHYSRDTNSEEQHVLSLEKMTEEEGNSTPRAGSPSQALEVNEQKASNRMSLPQFVSMLGGQDFGFGLDSYLTPSPPLSQEPTKATPAMQSTLADVERQQRPLTPVEQLEPPRYPGQGYESDEEPRTPDSVIRHPISVSPLPDSPSVPEPIATIKAPDGKLKTRPSITPADVQAMAETRRQISSELPPIPAIPEHPQGRPSVIAEAETSILQSSDETVNDSVSGDNDPQKQQKRKSSLVTLDIPVSSSGGLGFGLDKEFDRVIEAQKVASYFPLPGPTSQPWSPGTAEYIGGQGFRTFPEPCANKPVRSQKGYLMRQNTKIVVASSASHESAHDTVEPSDQTRGTRSAGNSPRKPSQQTWTTEPWNGKTRRKSVRLSGGSPQKKNLGGPAPPMPGQPSNVAVGLDSVAEDQLMSGEDFEDGTERGRLFVKVLRVKDLDLPLPKGRSFEICS